MFDDATTRHLHSGCALLVGTVSADGVPHASRGHGCRVLAGEPPRLRLIVPGDDERLLDNLRTTGVVAVTTADVATLHSVQCKGRASAVEAATDEDRATAARYTEQFVDDIVHTDRHRREMVETWATSASSLVACVVEVTEMFDQTPGPGAGTTWGARR